MQFAEYENPKFNIEKKDRAYKKQRTLAVMCTYIPQNLLGRYNSRLHRTHEYIGYEHNRLNSLYFTLAAYKHYNAGADYDLLIVDNSSPRTDWMDGTKEWIDIRENTHHSFGAYKYAWENYGEEYDYFVFHESDWSPAKDGWLKELIDYWNSDKQIGMIGNTIEQHGLNPNPSQPSHFIINNALVTGNKEREYQYNLDSEYFFIDKDVLRKMERSGGWNIFDCEPVVDVSPVINELSLQQPILEMGYKLACFKDGKHTVFYAIYNRGFDPRCNFGMENLTPFIPEQTRLFMPEAKEYFSWYDGPTSLV